MFTCTAPKFKKSVLLCVAYLLFFIVYLFAAKNTGFNFCILFSKANYMTGTNQKPLWLVEFLNKYSFNRKISTTYLDLYTQKMFRQCIITSLCSLLVSISIKAVHHIQVKYEYAMAYMPLHIHVH
jgi:hypothetical protein